MQKAANTPWKYGNDQIILKAKRCGRDLLTLLTKTLEEKKGSHGKSYYFDRRFTQIRTPNVDDPQFEYKCKRSVLYEFNRTLTSDGLGSISVGTMFNWMKKYRPYVGICPSMSEYCDTCKEKNEEISRYKQIITRLIQSGHATQGMAMVYMCCVALPCRLFDLACFFLPSFFISH